LFASKKQEHQNGFSKKLNRIESHIKAKKSDQKNKQKKKRDIKEFSRGGHPHIKKF